MTEGENEKAAKEVKVGQSDIACRSVRKAGCGNRQTSAIDRVM